MSMKLLTIGHSNHRFDKFVRLLNDNRIAILVDVRTIPASRYNPQFNRAQFEQALWQHNIQYVFAGQYLGGRPSDPNCYKNRVLPAEGVDYLHEVDYPAIMEKSWFQKGVARLLQLADEQTTVIMCSEEDPAQCHRHHLIAKYLMNTHPEVVIYHIRGDGIVFNAATLRQTVDDVNNEQLSLL